MKRHSFSGIRCVACAVGIAMLLLFNRCGQNESRHTLPIGYADNGKLTLPDGFEALVVVDSVGKARHLAVNKNGDIYIKLRGVTPQGGSVALRDTTGDGKADIIKYFGTYKDPKSYGTAMRIYNDHIYFSTTGTVYRNKLISGQLLPDTTTEAVVIDDYQAGPMDGAITKPITFDDRDTYTSVWCPRRYVPGREQSSRVSGQISLPRT